MKKLLLILVAFLGLMACQDIQYPEKPKNLIPKDKMVDVITDLYIFNAAKSYNRNLLQQSGLTMQEFIYEKHEIDSVQFQKSNAYYAANIEELEDIYTEVEERLKAQQQEIDTLLSEKQKRKQTNDSLTMSVDSIQSKIRSLPFLKKDQAN